MEACSPATGGALTDAQKHTNCVLSNPKQHCTFEVCILLEGPAAVHVTVICQGCTLGLSRNKFWSQQVTQVHTTTERALYRNYVRDLDDSLKQAVHDKHKVALSNQKSIYCQHGLLSSPTMHSGTCPPCSHEKECPQLQVWTTVQQQVGLPAEASIHAR